MPTKHKPDKRRWTTDDQEGWLKAKLPLYLAASSSNSFHKFWPTIFEQWFGDYREPAAKPEDYVETDDESENEPESDSNERVEEGLALKRKVPYKKLGGKKRRKVC